MNTEGIILRKAKVKDLKVIMNIYKNAIEAMENTGIHQWDSIYPNEEIIIKDILNKQMYLYEIDNQIASVFVLNQVYENEYNDGDWQYKESSFYIVHRLCVNPLFQGNGIGRMTMQLIEKRLQKNGIDTIRLDAFSLNPIALKMYEKLGYKRVGEVKWRKGIFYLFEKKI